ncbi:MAG: UDP-N-acetylmuramoyl-L-alanine--D-glutamate ligase [Lachnospiraceae bacterium]|jgi:UDP-N-acetylmuramoylalanine--D-glutamate ligase|nr:UDP-N-acetylmuramoyl-L-alanine--D-glutamate ligase [Lachnospiraceae bacterium]
MNLEEKQVMVVGLAKSGIEAARLCLRHGACVTVYDGKEAESLEPQLKELENEELHYILGRQPEEEELSRIDYMVLSPGVPTDLAFIQRARELGVIVCGEIELAAHFCRNEIIGITGTNGKTTTTTLVGQIMQAYAPGSLVAGNIGTPFSAMAENAKEKTYTTIELSSFQLESILKFRPHVAAILNFTPDHLDRHKTFENYVAAKCRIYENQTSDDFCIFNYDDPLCRERAEQLSKRENAPTVAYFSHQTPTQGGIWAEGDQMVADIQGSKTVLAEFSRLQILGAHNEENAMAAALCCLKAGVPVPVITEGLYAFKGVAHRIEPVGSVAGVQYYNDSKATNPDAAIKGLLAMRTPQTVLIGGGYDKGTPYDSWCQLFTGRVRRLILIGATRQDIYDCAVRCGYPAEQIEMADSFQEAVQKAAQSAQEGDSVLLSPACASWGMFKNYEERGDIFRELVQNMQ